MADYEKIKKEKEASLRRSKITPKEKAVLDYITQFESKGGDYNILYGGYKGDTGIPLTEMTVQEVLDFQEKMKSSGSSAVGAYQLINKTLLEEVKKQGISLDSTFTPELQDELIVGRLRRTRKLDDFVNGNISAEEFSLPLSQEFASIPLLKDYEDGNGKMHRKGQSYYAGDGMNKALVDTDSLSQVLNEIQVMPLAKKEEKNKPEEDTNSWYDGDDFNIQEEEAPKRKTRKERLQEFSSPSDTKTVMTEQGEVSAPLGILDEGYGYMEPTESSDETDLNAPEQVESEEPGTIQLSKEDIEQGRGEMPLEQEAAVEQEKRNRYTLVNPVENNNEGIPIRRKINTGKTSLDRMFNNTSAPMNADQNKFYYGGKTNKYSYGGITNSFNPVKPKGMGEIQYAKMVNKYNEGGIIDPPKEKLVSSTDGTPVKTTSFSSTTNKDGLKGITRTRNTTTPGTDLFKTPETTDEGNAAYAALTPAQQQAQDAKWRQMNRSNTTTETDSTYFLDPMQSEDINLRGMAGGTELPQIGDAAQYQGEPKRDPMYYIYGNSIPNSQFGGHSSSMITSDGSIKNDISHILSPGDISKNSPRSGERNIAIHRQLTEAEQDAAETRYGQSWHRPIPADIGEEMIRKEGENQAEVQRRNLQKHEESLVNQERVEGNIASDLAKRSEIEANKQAQIQARIAAKKQADAQKAAQRQEVIDSRSQNPMAKGGMIKRADGSYSKRGLWDNIRDNRGSGKKPTKQMLEHERKINAKAYGGAANGMQSEGEGFTEFKGGGTHEQNPLGGIPIGMGTNGKVNTVEENETKYKFKDGDYVFSNRIKI